MSATRKRFLVPRETRLLGFGVASRMTVQPLHGPGGPQYNEDGSPVMINVLELMFIDQQTGEIFILPLTDEGIAATQKALNPSSLIVPAPGSVRL
jgi:hypothetical protein